MWKIWHFQTLCTPPRPSVPWSRGAPQLSWLSQRWISPCLSHPVNPCHQLNIEHIQAKYLDLKWKKKTHNSKNKWAAYQTNLETVACALTDIILHSPFKKLIEFLPIWLLQTDFILEPIQPYFCRMWQNGVTDKVLFVKNFIIHTPTFSEWEKLAHPLPGLTQREKLPLLLQ